MASLLPPDLRQATTVPSESKDELSAGPTHVVILATVDADDVAEALDLAWRAFRKATGEDLAGWTWPAPRPRYGRKRG